MIEDLAFYTGNIASQKFQYIRLGNLDDPNIRGYPNATLLVFNPIEITLTFDNIGECYTGKYFFAQIEMVA